MTTNTKEGTEYNNFIFETKYSIVFIYNAINNKQKEMDSTKGKLKRMKKIITTVDSQASLTIKTVKGDQGYNIKKRHYSINSKYR